MNNLLGQKWCLCLNVQNRIKLCRAKNHKFGDDTTVRLTKTTAAQNEDTLSYYKVRGLYFLAVVFMRSIVNRLNQVKIFEKII